MKVHKKHFSHEIVRKKVSGWNFQLEWNCLGGIFLEGGGYCYAKRYFPRWNFSVGEGVFHLGEPNLPALFEND